MREQLGVLGPVRVLGRPATTGASRVLHVRDATGGRWYAKHLTKPMLWEREASAYRLWQHLPQVPTPRAVCPETHCLLLPDVRGRQPSGQSRRALRKAGFLLGRLHDHPAPGEWTSDWRELVPRDVDRKLGALSRAGISVNTTMVKENAQHLVSLDLPEVSSHGDFQPHNWRVRGGGLFVFDFARAGRRPAAFDWGRLLYAACWDEPTAFDSLLEGYGRQPTSTELQFLTAMLPWRAVVAMHLGLRHGKPEMVNHAHRVLAAVERGDHWLR